MGAPRTKPTERPVPSPAPASATVDEDKPTEPPATVRSTMTVDEYKKELKKLSVGMEHVTTGDELADMLAGRNLYLVGMMACGKSSVGRDLSVSLGQDYSFMDTDSLIE